MLVALSLRFDIGPVVLVVLFLLGVELRVFSFGIGYSDVGAVTRAAIDVVMNGGNPYGVGYDVSTPPGASFPYGPLALLWYLPFQDTRLVEMAVSIAILGVLALRGRTLGLAIWATSPIFVQLAGDGSNDTSAGLLILAALVVLERLPIAGALLLGLAAGFKVYALAWLPPVFAWTGLTVLLAGMAGAALVWLPAILMWGADAILRSFQLTDINKDQPYYSLAEALSHFRIRPSKQLMTVTAYVWGTLTAVASLFVVRSFKGVVVGGIVIFTATLFTGWWSTAAYLAAIAPVLCWYVDFWLGPSGDDADDDPTRVRWPGDPVGRLKSSVNRRWPVAP